ncbi:MAG: nucleotidyltransferase family protein [Thermoleophilaceae bacterium]
MDHGTPAPEDLEAALKASAAALRDAGVPFMLGGSLAAWVRGGPPSRKDLDLMLAPGDAGRALEVLAEAGLRTERPPEDWLFKAWHGHTLIDLIFRPKGLELDDGAFGRAEQMDVFAIPMLVMSLEDMVATKLLVLDEHSLDLEPMLQIARALRERIDWEQVRAQTAESAFAKAFFTLVEELGIVERREGRPAARRGRVRVVGTPDPGEAAGRAG